MNRQLTTQILRTECISLPAHVSVAGTGKGPDEDLQPAFWAELLHALEHPRVCPLFFAATDCSEKRRKSNLPDGGVVQPANQAPAATLYWVHLPPGTFTASHYTCLNVQNI